MRFGLIHRIMTDALAALGLLALISSGELNRWITIGLVVGLVLALAVPEKWQDKAWLRQIGVIAPIALLVAQITRLVFGASVLALAVEFAAALQVVRLSTRRGAAHDQQVVVLALLHLIAGTVLGGGLAYGLCFLGFLVVAPGALVLSHLRREVEGNYRQGARDRTGLPVDVPRILRSRRVIGKQFLAFTCLLSVPIFLFTALLFVMFPRVGLSLLLLNHARPERMIGFSDKVDLGGVGKLRSDPTIAMRIEYPDLPAEPPPRLALYLRGTAFDQYNGKSWSRSSTQRVPAETRGGQIRITRVADPVHDKKLIVDLEPIDPPVVFLPPEAISLRLLSRGTPLLGGAPTVVAGPEGEFKYLSIDDRGLRYEVYLAGLKEPPARALSPAERQRYLTVPSDLPPRIAELARSWVGGETNPARQAKLIETRLRREYQYDLESPSGASSNPLDHFLFESKRGHCEFYSTAMAVMLRTLGVPTRNVTGFIGGTYNRFGRYYAVRQGDAHSWIEVHLEHKGWTRFDPTPPSDAAPQSDITGVLAFVRDFVEAAAQRWNRHVVGYDLKQQVHLLRAAQRRYSEIRQSSDIMGGAIASPTRIALGLGGILLLALGVYWLKRQRGGESEAKPKRPGADPNLTQIVALYRALDAAMAARGIGRSPSTPPLAHARALVELGHPAADEILDLTRLYVEARFGGRSLDDETRRDYARRVKLLRQVREDVAHAA